MKKIKRLIAVFMSTIVLFGTFGVKALAAEAETTSKIKVYDSKGTLIEELDSSEELNKYGINEDERSAKTKIMKLVKELGKELVIEFLKAGISDGFKYLKEYKITIPVIDDGESATVYSLDGNIYNPYPPNSYEGATWINTNFLVVVN